ncbi:DUF4157 domain-containing protein [Micromonospora sp. CPCC 206061]
MAHEPEKPATPAPDDVRAALTAVGSAAIARWASGEHADASAGPVMLSEPAVSNRVAARWAERNAPAPGTASDATERDAHDLAGRALRGSESTPGADSPAARSGDRLPDGVRGRMESSFGESFDDVRVHDSEGAHSIAQSLDARAVTVGTDIYFDRGRFKPGGATGDSLIAHELAHVVQYRNGQMSPETAGRWQNLGSEGWSVPGWGRHQSTVWVGSEAEWRGVLDEADNDEVYTESLQGFLRAACDPGMIGRKNHELGWPDYHNDVKRAPTRAEIMEFLKALYGLGEDLDLSPNWLFGSGTHLRLMRGELSAFVTKYQGDLIQLISREGVGGSKVIDQGDVGAVAEEGGKEVRVNMVNSAMTTAVEGLAQLIRAHAEGDEGAKSDAYSVISNSGLVIRRTLDVHEEAIKFEGEVNMFLIDLVLDVTKLDEMPGVQSLLRRTPAVKGLLKNTIKKMGAGAAKSGNPMEQADAIMAAFENDVKELGPAAGVDSVLDANTERLAITTFSAAMSKK